MGTGVHVGSAVGVCVGSGVQVGATAGSEIVHPTTTTHAATNPAPAAMAYGPNRLAYGIQDRISVRISPTRARRDSRTQP